MVKEGTSRCNVFKKSRLEKALRYSLIPKAMLLKKSFHVPPYPKASMVSLRSKSVLP